MKKKEKRNLEREYKRRTTNERRIKRRVREQKKPQNFKIARTWSFFVSPKAKKKQQTRKTKN